LDWYEKALRGRCSKTIGDVVLQKLHDEIMVEFPATDNAEFMRFYTQRGYNTLSDTFWVIS
jgi:hypothetical protein